MSDFGKQWQQACRNCEVFDNFGKSMVVFIVAMPASTPPNQNVLTLWIMVKQCQKSALLFQNSVLYCAHTLIN
jgi:hypothetical protein